MSKISSAFEVCQQHCTGCGGCAQICPVGAIAMKADARGCVYPVIDDTACIQCGKCLNICRKIQRIEARRPLHAHAAVGKNRDLIENSASGGVFASTALEWIRQGGAVAGAVMDCTGNGVQVYHILSDCPEDIARMQGSKYVHSEAWRCYQDVAAALKAGRRVLFSGTPCQSAAVRAITGDPQNLVTMDLICHGVPPLAMLSEYAAILSGRLGGKLKTLTFRDKSTGKNFCARIGIQYKYGCRDWFLRSHDLSYYAYFLEGAIYRDNCYDCPYAQLKRVSDVTIGDYWGVERWHGEEISAGRMPAAKDWSCILVSSEKGKAFLDAYGGELNLFDTDAEWISAENQQLNSPHAKPACRAHLFDLYEKGGYAGIEDSFIRNKGGRLRYSLRFLRNLRRNQKLRSSVKDKNL